MGDVRLEQILLVEDGVDEVGVALDLVDQARVDDLQDHAKDLLQDSNVGDGLADRGVVIKAWNND